MRRQTLPRIPRTRTPALSAALVAVVATLALPSAAPADKIVLGGIAYNNVKIVGMKDGKLFVLLPKGETGIDLGDIESLDLDLYPELAKADAALNDQNWAGAADIYEPLFDKVTEDYLKVLVGAKLVVSLDKSGRFDKAVQRYTQLLARDKGALVQAAAPKTVPEDKDKVAAAKKLVDTLLAAEADPFVKEFLTNTKKRLAGEKVAGDDDPAVGPSILVGDKEAARDPIQEAIDAGKAAEVIEQIESKLQQPKQELSKLLYQHGEALMALNRPMDAAISYMRVVVHYRSNTTPYYVPALIGAAKAMIKTKDPDHARGLLDEAAKLVGDDAEALKPINAVRATLPKK